MLNNSLVVTRTTDRIYLLASLWITHASLKSPRPRPM